MRLLLSIVFLVAFAVAGCGDDDTSAESGDDPFDLSTVGMPRSDLEILQILDSMPDQISGLPFSPRNDYDLVRQYGDLNTIVAIPFPTDGGSAAPESLAEDLSQFELEAGAVVEGSQLNPASDLVWLTGWFTDQGGAGVVYIAVWGEPAGNWAFNVSAETPEMREAIVRAFVEAVRATG
jgi:hypothetical protein